MTRYVKRLSGASQQESLIPVLASSEKVGSSFGYLSPQQDSTWKPNSTLTVRIDYEDLYGRKYQDEISLPIRGFGVFHGFLLGLSCSC